MNQLIRQIYKKIDAKKRQVVFVDRDGTLNKEVNYLYKKTDLELLPTVIEGIKQLNDNNFVVIVITNQPVVAKGLIDVNGVREINNELISQLEEKNCIIHAIYSCPHHPNATVATLKVKCQCRKPLLRMFEKAVIDFNIQMSNAYMIGDSTRDIQAGKNAGIPTFLVKTGYAGRDSAYPVSADVVCENFSTAVQAILTMKQ